LTTTKKEVSRERLLLRTRPTFSQCLMVSIGISELGWVSCLTTRALRSTALTTAMCSCQSSYYPWCARYQGNFSSFNRTTPSTPARDTVRLNSSLLLPDLWPANSPDLNPVDYRIRSVIQQRVYQLVGVLSKKIVHILKKAWNFAWINLKTY